MLDMAATAPAAHIILQGSNTNTAVTALGLQRCPGSAGTRHWASHTPTLRSRDQMQTNPASARAK
ncbi:hypothetical protein Nmel_010986 [Mimus melanotis]